MTTSPQLGAPLMPDANGSELVLSKAASVDQLLAQNSRNVEVTLERAFQSLRESAEKLVREANDEFAESISDAEKRLHLLEKCFNRLLSAEKERHEEVREYKRHIEELRRANEAQAQQLEQLRRKLPQSSPPSQQNARGTNKQKNASRKRPPSLTELFASQGLEFVDNRPRGALWVVGGKSLGQFFRALEAERGVKFSHFDSPRATRGRPAWFTKSAG